MAIDIDELQIDASRPRARHATPLSIPEDATNTNAFDGNGVVVTNVPVPPAPRD